MYAIIVTGGKQYTVSQGDTLFVEKLDAQPDETITFEQVLMVSTDEGAKIGTPVLEGAKVTATVLKNGKNKKIRIFKQKPKKGYRRHMGHRQPYTKVEIKEITL